MLVDAAEGLRSREIRVVALGLAGDPRVQGVMNVVRPLGGHAEAGHAERRFGVRGCDDSSVVEIRLGHQRQGAAESLRELSDGIGQFGQQVRVRIDGGGAVGVVADLVDGVQPQRVDVEVCQPAQGGVDDERAHLLAAGLVVVDRRAPRRLVHLGEVWAEAAQIVARGAQVVVDDVEAHADAGVVRGVNETGQRLGPAVGLVDRP